MKLRFFLMIDKVETNSPAMRDTTWQIIFIRDNRWMRKFTAD